MMRRFPVRISLSTRPGSALARTALARTVLAGSALAVGLALVVPAGTAYGTARADGSKPTAAARKAGVERGNATMGWKHRSVERADSGLALAPTPLKKMTGVLGIDVSAYQPHVNWRSYRAQGRVFAFIKATEGTSYRSKTFASQWSGSAGAGVMRGAYHFANPGGKSGTAQADYFVNNGGRWVNDGKTLPGVLDIEYNPYGKNMCYGISQRQMVGWIAAFTSRYKARTGRDAIIYTTTGWWKACTGNTTRFSRTNPLWVARWSSRPGELPGGWPFYTFWQYASGSIDQNKFSASYTRLQVLARGY
jgi:GH25 family lysozyme M1 (1,4-beta-N-acetylmuramidase)